MPQDKTLAHLADESALRRLAMRYAQCCDRRDGDTFVTLFAPGAVLAGVGSPADTPEKLRGIPPMLSMFVKTYHTIFNYIVDVDGDRATGEAYTLAHHLKPRADGKFDDILMYITYRDKYVRGGEAWQFQHRDVVIEFTENRIVDDEGGKLPKL